MTCNGLRVHYLEWGDRGGRPLVAVHGLHGNAHTWDGLARVLDEGYWIVAPDLRGHGDTQWAADGAYSPEVLLEDFTAYVEALGLGRFGLIGESLGGIVSFAFAATNPEAVERLAVLDIGPDLGEAGMEQIRSSAGSRPASFEDLDEALRWSLPAHPLADQEALRHNLAANLKRGADGRLRWRYDPRVDGLVSAGGPQDGRVLWDLWSAVACPTLVVRGVHSDLLTTETALKMLALSPGARLVEVPGAGHSLLTDNPSRVLDAVRQFLLG